MTRKKIAIILSRFPYPLDKGDKLRAFHQIMYLSRFHDLHVFALCEAWPSTAHVNELKPYCCDLQVFRLKKSTIFLQSALSLFKKSPLQAGYFYDPGIARTISKAIHALQPDTVYAQLSRTAWYAKDLPFHKVIDFQDAFSLNYQRISEQASGIKKWFYRRESRLMQQFESRMMDWFNETTIISNYDKESLAQQPNRTMVVGNGVDMAFFAPRTATKKCDVLFSGNLRYLPNQLAVEFLIEDILPLLLQHKPDLQLNIAGGSAPFLETYRQRYPANVTISGWVDDIRTAYAETRLYVAPLFTGAGIQNKILEAMSMQIPCITTPVVNASLRAAESRQIWIAGNAQEFADKILALLGNEEAQRDLAQQGYHFVKEHYTWDKANAALLPLL